MQEQNRSVGGFIGENTAVAGVNIADNAIKNVANNAEKPAAKVLAKEAAKETARDVSKEPAKEAPVAPLLKSADVNATLSKFACTACHGIDNKIVGPSFKEIATKQGKKTDVVAYLMGKIKAGSSGVYGSIPMPPQNASEAELKKMAQWIASGATK